VKKLVDNSKNYFEIENHIRLANATRIKLKITSPSFLLKTMCERLFLNMSPVKHIVNGGEKNYAIF